MFNPRARERACEKEEWERNTFYTAIIMSHRWLR